MNLEESTAQESRDARAEVGDDDHADIRGFVTALHMSVAGRPRCSVGDDRVDAHRGGCGFSGRGLGGNLPVQYSDHRTEIHQEAETKPLDVVQGASSPADHPG